MDVLCGLVFFILRKFYKAHGYVPEIGMEQRLSLCSFFCTHFGDKNWDMTETEKGVISGECLVLRRKNHTEGKAIT